jgi:hypothetical protein
MTPFGFARFETGSEFFVSMLFLSMRPPFYAIRFRRTS